MSPRSAWSSGGGARLCRRLVVALVLVGQVWGGIGAGTSVRQHATLSALEAATVFCHAGQGGRDQSPPLRQHVADPIIMQSAASLAHEVGLLSPHSVLRAPSQRPASVGRTQAARAPPVRVVATPPATGPPAFA